MYMPELIGGVRLPYVVTEQKQNYSSGKPFASYINETENKSSNRLKREFTHTDKKDCEQITRTEFEMLELFHVLPLATANDSEHVFRELDEFVELTSISEFDDNKLHAENELPTSSILANVKVINDQAYKVYRADNIVQYHDSFDQSTELPLEQLNAILSSVSGDISGELVFVSGDVNADDLNYSTAFPVPASGDLNVGSLNESTQSTLTHDYINRAVTQGILKGTTSSSSHYIYNELYMLKSIATGHLDQRVIKGQSNQLFQVVGNVEQNNVPNREASIEGKLSIDQKVKLDIRLTRDILNSIVNLKSVNNSESSNSERVGKFTPLISAELKRIDPQLKRNLSFFDGNNGGVKVYLRDYALSVEELIVELLPLLSLLPNAETMPIQVVINGNDVTESALKQINRGRTNAS